MNNKNKEISLKISNGPCELDLVIALMRGNPVEFTVDGRKVPVIIFGMTVESFKERTSWQLRGEFETHNQKALSLRFPHKQKFTASYNLKAHRTGWLLTKNPFKDLLPLLKIGTKLRRTNDLMPNEPANLNSLIGQTLKVIAITTTGVRVITEVDWEGKPGDGFELHILNEELTSQFFEIID